MALISTVQPSSLLAIQLLQNNRLKRNNSVITARATTIRTRAAKLPAGVVVPREEPRLSEPFLGFTKTAEVWNSRACTIGVILHCGAGAEQGCSSDNWCGSGERTRSSTVVLQDSVVDVHRLD